MLAGHFVLRSSNMTCLKDRDDFFAAEADEDDFYNFIVFLLEWKSVNEDLSLPIKIPSPKLHIAPLIGPDPMYNTPLDTSRYIHLCHLTDQ